MTVSQWERNTSRGQNCPVHFKNNDKLEKRHLINVSLLWYYLKINKTTENRVTSFSYVFFSEIWVHQFMLFIYFSEIIVFLVINEMELISRLKTSVLIIQGLQIPSRKWGSTESNQLISNPLDKIQTKHLFINNKHVF